jgi:uncharacterized membrane protein
MISALERRRKWQQARDLTAAITVRRPVSEVYDFWRRLENLPAFVTHLDTVRATGELTSHWTSSAILGRQVEWDALIVEDLPGEGFRWASVGDAEVPTTGAVFFAPAPDGVSAEVYVGLMYDTRKGEFGRALAKYFGDDPHQPIAAALHRMKQLLEIGEVTRSDGAPWGKCSRAEFPQHPARPLSAEEFAKGPPV